MTEAEKFLALEGVVAGEDVRWVARRKAAFLTALNRWPEESAALMEALNVSADEIVSWRNGMQRAGHSGLKVRDLDDRRAERVDAPRPPPQRRRSAPARPALTDPWRER